MVTKAMTNTVAGMYHEVRASLPQSVAPPREWLGLYEDFISKNASSVSQIESGLRSLTYILPGRFQQAEIASESLHSFIQLLSLYHDSLLSSVYSRLPVSIPRPLPTPHARYTNFWTTNSSIYRRVALILQTIQYTELLWEMIAKRRGNRTRWRVIVILESVKALCRLLLMRLTKSRPLVSPPLPEREADPRAAAESEEDTISQWDGMNTPPLLPNESPMSELNWTMPRTGLTLPSLPDGADISDFLLKKVLTADDIKAPRQLLHRLTTLQSQMAEVLWIMRPVLYALAMQRLQGDRSKPSWQPWLVGICLEIAARRLAKRDLADRMPRGLRGMTGLEREELGKRGWSMAWWAMRGPFHDQYTGRLIRSVAGKLKGLPLLDIVGTVVEDYEHLWSDFYFSTATM